MALFFEGWVFPQEQQSTAFLQNWSISLTPHLKPDKQRLERRNSIVWGIGTRYESGFNASLSTPKKSFDFSYLTPYGLQQRSAQRPY